jgi:hypothetical protein
MADADNDHCNLVTIMLSRSGSLDGVREVARRVRTELRNLRDRNARIDRRWRGVEMIGQVEVDALGPTDIDVLPPQRRAVISALPSFGGSSGYATWDQIVTWVTHIHVAVHAPKLSRGDLRDAFEKQWPGVGRVDVRPFHPGTANENAGSIIAYASKHEMRTTLKDGFEVEWPVAVQAVYWGWLHSLRSGLAPLRVRIGAIKDKTAAPDSPSSKHQNNKPMPMTF